MTPLLQTLHKIIRWAAPGEIALVVASDDLQETALPAGVQLTRTTFRGVRKAVKGRRAYGQAKFFAAHWPEDGQVETLGVPKLLCVSRGHTDFQIGQNVIHCGEGCFILLPPGTPHPDGSTAHLDNSADGQARVHCELFWLGRWGRQIYCWMCHSEGQQHWAHDPSEHCILLNETANQTLDLLVAEATARQPGWNAIANDHLHALLLLVQREIQSGRTFGPGFDTAAVESAAPTPDDPIEQAQHYIRHHLNQHPTLASVSRRVFLSRARFAERFHTETGMTFGEYVTHRRIEEAKILLRDSNWNIANISRFIGINSVPYFCQLFKKQTGYTPSQFRRQTHSQPPPAHKSDRSAEKETNS